MGVKHKLFEDGNEMHEQNQSLETPKTSADGRAHSGEAFKPGSSTRMEPLNDDVAREMFWDDSKRIKGGGK